MDVQVLTSYYCYCYNIIPLTVKKNFFFGLLHSLTICRISAGLVLITLLVLEMASIIIIIIIIEGLFIKFLKPNISFSILFVYGQDQCHNACRSINTNKLTTVTLRQIAIPCIQLMHTKINIIIIIVFKTMTPRTPVACRCVDQMQPVMYSLRLSLMLSQSKCCVPKHWHYLIITIIRLWMLEAIIL